MDKLEEIKSFIKAGRVRLIHINWMVKEIERLRELNRAIKEKSRFKNYLNVVEENLALEESLKKVRAQRDYYKKLYSTNTDMKKAL
ncbi:hypothetical protein [Cytobacillus purgationiresistens]|uniref:Uncharacterized protein n=1 Tax=Cytobacillus purgationiresistens TaxID=863449 RepID=A0ABU0ADF4_9BACI|nr:hypothetical protein [Cytobacillus purgationiresistens]MDQ0268909.1 hypothetical protein [Cytobacillus purgationiresistens]